MKNDTVYTNKVQQLLKDLKYLDEDEEYNFDDAIEDDEVLHNEKKVESSKECNNDVHNLKSNSFKKQLQRMSNEDGEIS